MTIRLKVIDRKRAILGHMRVKRQHQRWTLLHKAHASMTMAMHAAFVAFGTLTPTLQVQIVGREISRLASPKHPRCKAVHYLGKMLVDGVDAGLPPLLQRDEPRLTLVPRGRGARSQGALHRLQVLGVEAHLLQSIA